MKKEKSGYLTLLCVVTLAWPFVTNADLLVLVNKPKVTGNKAVVSMQMENTFDVPIQSARATVFLVDDKNHVVGQSTTKWVIGGAKGKQALAAGHETAYNFVISAISSGSIANLTANVSFNRVVLANGKLADLTKQVIIAKPK